MSHPYRELSIAGLGETGVGVMDNIQDAVQGEHSLEMRRAGAFSKRIAKRRKFRV